MLHKHRTILQLPTATMSAHYNDHDELQAAEVTTTVSQSLVDAVRPILHRGVAHICITLRKDMPCVTSKDVRIAKYMLFKEQKEVEAKQSACKAREEVLNGMVEKHAAKIRVAFQHHTIRRSIQKLYGARDTTAPLSGKSLGDVAHDALKMFGTNQMRLITVAHITRVDGEKTLVTTMSATLTNIEHTFEDGLQEHKETDETYKLTEAHKMYQEASFETDEGLPDITIFEKRGVTQALCEAYETKNIEHIQHAIATDNMNGVLTREVKKHVTEHDIHFWTTPHDDDGNERMMGFQIPQNARTITLGRSLHVQHRTRPNVPRIDAPRYTVDHNTTHMSEIEFDTTKDDTVFFAEHSRMYPPKKQTEAYTIVAFECRDRYGAPYVGMVDFAYSSQSLEGHTQDKSASMYTGPVVVFPYVQQCGSLESQVLDYANTATAPPFLDVKAVWSIKP